MDIVKLEARTRTETGKGPSRQLRRDGLVPSVSYKRGEPTLSLAVPREALRGILKSSRGRNTLIDLAVEGGDTYAVMVKDYVVHPLTRQLVHADFIQVSRDEPIEVEVPFQRTGRSKGEIEGGTLLQTVRTLTVRCLPVNIPDCIEADVSELQIDDVMRVADLTPPEDTEILHPAEQKVVVVKPPRVEEVAAEAEGEEGVEGEEGEKPAEGEEGAAAKPDEGGDKGAPGGDKSKD